MISFKKQKSWLSIRSWSGKPIANESFVYMSGKLKISGYLFRSNYCSRLTLFECRKLSRMSIKFSPVQNVLTGRRNFDHDPWPWRKWNQHFRSMAQIW
jgi:hypothetical protein